MSRRGINIYRRKDGRYEGRYSDGYLDNSKRKYHSIYGKTYSEVRDRLLQIKTNMLLHKTACCQTVKMLFGEWLKAKQLITKESTYSNYVFKVERHLIPSFGNINFNKLTPEMIYTFIRKKKDSGLSDKYISDLIVVMKNMTKYIAKMHHCDDPIANAELPKQEKREIKLYSKSEQSRLKSILLSNIDITKAIILFTLYTGVRIGEICGVKWTDIDFTTKTLRIERTIQRIGVCGQDRKTQLIVSTPKSKSSNRVIPLPEFLLQILKAFKQSDVNTFIVTGSYELPDPRTLRYRFEKLLAANGLRKIKFHSLRHMFATNCIELGFDVKTLSEILGHSSVEITLNRYVHSSMERKRQCMDMLTLN